MHSSERDSRGAISLSAGQGMARHPPPMGSSALSMMSSRILSVNCTRSSIGSLSTLLPHLLPRCTFSQYSPFSPSGRLSANSRQPRDASEPRWLRYLLSPTPAAQCPSLDAVAGLRRDHTSRTHGRPVVAALRTFVARAQAPPNLVRHGARSTTLGDVRMHGVGAPTKVHVVRIVEGRLILKHLAHLQLVLEVAALRVQLGVVALDAPHLSPVVPHLHRRHRGPHHHRAAVVIRVKERLLRTRHPRHTPTER